MIYFLQHHETGHVKIGTTEHYHTRLSWLRSQFGKLTLLGLMDGSYPEEAAIHQQFDYCRQVGEQGREWFRPVGELLQFIQEHTHQEIPKRSTDWTTIYASKETLSYINDVRRMLELGYGRKFTTEEIVNMAVRGFYGEILEQTRRDIGLTVVNKP